jgi:hypothetical protein
MNDVAENVDIGTLTYSEKLPIIFVNRMVYTRNALFYHIFWSEKGIRLCDRVPAST